MIFGIQVTTGHYGVGMDYFIFIGLFGHGLLAEKMLRDNFVCVYEKHMWQRCEK